MQPIIKDIIQWDIKSWSRALKYWDENIDWNKIHNCLELGAGKGGLSLWIAIKGKRIVCSDINDVKNKTYALHSRYNIREKIHYQDISAINIPYDNCFDIIIFKSIIGSIGSNNDISMQQKVFKEIYKALKPGGKLLFAENLIASPLHKLFRKKYIPWANSWRYISISEMKGFLYQFSSFDLKTTGFLGTFGRNEIQRYFFAIMDGIIFDKLLPDKWKYIAYGMAGK